VIDLLLRRDPHQRFAEILPCSRLAGWPTARADQKTGKPLDYDPNKDVQT
jgi:hypothetical protein